MQKALGVASVAGALFILHGCGGAGGADPDDPDDPDAKSSTSHQFTDETTSTLSTSSSTTTTTTTKSWPARIPALSGKAVAAWLNSQYMNHNPSDDASPLGVVITMKTEFQFYCKKALQTECYQGHADCFVSTSLYNKFMCRNTWPGGLHPAMDRVAGVILNSTAVEQRQAKCGYQFDGVTWGRYNNGCGGITEIGPGKCEDFNSAFWNYCDVSAKRECNANDAMVLKDWCPKVDKEPTRPEDAPCYWKGAGFYPEGGSTQSEIRDMVRQRIKNQENRTDLRDRWNEVVLDAEVLVADLEDQPALAVPAILWVQQSNHWDDGGNRAAREYATSMAATMAQKYALPTPVPIIGVNPKVNIDDLGPSSGPFFFDKPTDPFTEVLV